MWKSQGPKKRLEFLRQIAIDAPLSASKLKEFHTWWQHEETPRSILGPVKEFAMDGHEKVATKCHDDVPSRGGRPRKDGSQRLANTGWFMVTDPKTGSILGIKEMKDPENANIALDLVEDLLPFYMKVNCALYDRACSVLKKASARKSLSKIRFWCVDKFHARGHCAKCKCSPAVHAHLAKRVKNVNTSISEQTFAWFRGYASSFNSMNADVQRFYVLSYARRHNVMLRKDDAAHLNPWSAHKQAMKKAGVWKKPASKAYGCKPVRKDHLKKKPAKK